MRIGVLCNENCRIALKTYFYLNKRGIAEISFIIETEKRLKFSENERLFIKNHHLYKGYLLRRNPIFLLRRVIQKINSLINVKSNMTIEAFSTKKNISFCKVKRHSSDEAKDYILKNKLEYLLLTSTSWLLKDPLINIPNLKIINAHNALLPKHRGLDALFWSIFEGDELRLSAHFIDEGIDSGPILDSIKIKPHIFDDILTFRENSFKTRPKFFYQILKGLENNTIKPFIQDINDGVLHKPMTLDELIITGKKIRKYKC